MGKLTGRVFSSGHSLTDLIHIVRTGDTSQGPSGSSYKAQVQSYANLILGLLPSEVFVTGGTYSLGTATFTNSTGGTFNVTGFYTGNLDVYVTGGTYSNGNVTFTNNTGGTFNVSGLSTGTSSSDTFVTGGTYVDGITTFTNNTGGTFTVDQTFKQNIIVALKSGDSLGKYHDGDTIPTFNGFSRTNFTPLIYDLCNIMVTGVETFTWSTTTPLNIQPNSVSIAQNVSGTSVMATGLSHTGGSTALASPHVITSTTPIENKVIYTVSATNTQSGVFSRTINASWRYRFYYGKSPLTDLTTQAQVSGLTGQALVVGVTNSFVNVPASVGNYIYLIVPVGVAQPSDLKDSVSGCFGNNIPYQLQGTIVITTFGVATTYNKYRSINTIDGSINVWMCA